MSAEKRKHKDVMSLMTSGHNVQLVNDNICEFTVVFNGPKDSPYEGVSSNNSCREFGVS